MAVSLQYTRCYCEENVYLCLEAVRQNTNVFDKSYAVFMTSYQCDPAEEVPNTWTSTVPYRSFRSARFESDFLVWDYHVIAVVRARSTKRWFAIDLDSCLPHSTDTYLEDWAGYCIPLEEYNAKTLFLETEAPLQHRAHLGRLMNSVRYRIILAEEYLCFFRSDRSHMRDSSGVYAATPPPWPAIATYPQWANAFQREKARRCLAALPVSMQKRTLTSLINVSNEAVPGSILDRQHLLFFFSDLT